MNKKLFSFFFAAIALQSPSVKAACSYDQYASDMQNFNNIASSNLIGTVCGQEVNLIGQNPKANTGVGLKRNFFLAPDFNDNIQLAYPLQIIVNGKTIYSGTTLTLTDLNNFLRALGVNLISVISSPFASASLASTSSSMFLSNTLYRSVIDPSFKTHAQEKKKQKEVKTQNFRTFMTDVRYEHVEFKDSKNSGNLAGFTAGVSYDFNEHYTVGAILPYDYLGFKSFEAHRTGLIVYGTTKWDVLAGLELSATLNGNYLYTDMGYKNSSKTFGMNTNGLGFSTRLEYDDGGDFLSSLAFSIQYNEDSKIKIDDHQYLLKIGPSVGYRIGDQAVVKVFGTWNKDLTYYRTLANKANDSDFFDVGIEGGYYVSDSWQIKGGFKKVLGLRNFESDSVYIGSSLSF